MSLRIEASLGIAGKYLGEHRYVPHHPNTVFRPKFTSDHALVDPAFIVRVRKKLALDQRRAGEIFGGGINAFSRYETGKTKPPLALVKLLKILDRHPDLLKEIAAA
nr:hypothetical protein DBT45_10410 [Aerococcus tenax]